MTQIDLINEVSAVTAMGIEGSNGQTIKGLTGRLPIQLYLTCNDNYMTQYQCIIRKQIEFFEATEADTETVIQGRNKPIVLGQVGIRCRHCSLFEAHPDSRPNGSTYYPAKLDSIYQAGQNMAQFHLLETCQYIPQQVRDELIRLKEKTGGTKRNRAKVGEKSAPGGGKQFWIKNAMKVGILEDTESNILRFDPCWSMKILLNHANEDQKEKDMALLRSKQDELLAKEDEYNEPQGENECYVTGDEFCDTDEEEVHQFLNEILDDDATFSNLSAIADIDLDTIETGSLCSF
jgi:hypothetical protein